MGRPSKLTPEVQERILQAIRAGNYIETAAKAAGIDESTFYRWMQLGAKARRGRYFEFRKAVEKARAEAEVRNVAIVAKAATEEWQAAAWWLERSFPDRWGRRRFDLNHSVDSTAWEAMVAALRRARGLSDDDEAPEAVGSGMVHRDLSMDSHQGEAGHPVSPEPDPA